MSIEALNWAFNLPLDKPVLKAVLIGIANHANPAGEAWPSVERLMLYSGYKERAVRKALSELEELGFMAVQERPGRTNLFALSMRGARSAGVHDVQGRGACGAPEPTLTTIQKDKRGQASRMSPLWNPGPELLQWAREARPDIDVGHETDCFRDYWLANGATKLDWSATYRNWIRRARAVWKAEPRSVRPSPAAVAESNNQRVRRFFDDMADDATDIT